MRKGKPYLSIVVPVYNERNRITNLREIHAYLKSKKFKSELIVVNDGSNDTTMNQLRKIASEFPVKIISYKKNQGKGFALKKGMLAASGLYRLFTDIDLSTPIETCDKFIKGASDYHVIIGTRKHLKSNIIIHQPKLR